MRYPFMKPFTFQDRVHPPPFVPLPLRQDLRGLHPLLLLGSITSEQTRCPLRGVREVRINGNLLLTYVTIYNNLIN